MLIATFGQTTAWAGRRITYEDDTFVLEGHGTITTTGIMEYDRQGHLLWVNAGTRAWVGSKATGSAPSRTPAVTETPRTGEARHATEGMGRQPRPRPRKHVKRALLVAIIVLGIANAVLLLTILGVFRGL
jgi:hypothetical protein